MILEKIDTELRRQYNSYCVDFKYHEANAVHKALESIHKIFKDEFQAKTEQALTDEQFNNLFPKLKTVEEIQASMNV